jgi:hypothetical protein
MFTFVKIMVPSTAVAATAITTKATTATKNGK